MAEGGRNHEAQRVSVVSSQQHDVPVGPLHAETGGVCIAPQPADEGAPIIPAMAMRPFFGIQPVLMGEQVSCD